MFHKTLLLASLCACGLGASHAWAQGSQVVNSVPFRTANSSFFERMGFGWNYTAPARGNFGGATVNFGGFNNATPPFGGFAPGAGATGGVGFGTGGGGRFNLFGEFSQGSRSSLSSVTPSVTTMNGQIGFVADQAQSPFVISVVPVVGHDTFQDYGASNTLRGRLLRGEIQIPTENSLGHQLALPPGGGTGAVVPNQPPLVIKKPNANPLVLRASAPAAADNSAPAAANSTADDAETSLAEIRRRQALEQELQAQSALTEAQDRFVKGQRAEEEGKPAVAKIHYQMALRRSSGELRTQIADRLSALTGQPVQ